MWGLQDAINEQVSSLLGMFLREPDFQSRMEIQVHTPHNQSTLFPQHTHILHALASGHIHAAIGRCTSLLSITVQITIAHVIHTPSLLTPKLTHSRSSRSPPQGGELANLFFKLQLLGYMFCNADRLLSASSSLNVREPPRMPLVGNLSGNVTIQYTVRMGRGRAGLKGRTEMEIEHIPKHTDVC